MRKIYKYQIETKDVQTIQVPKLIGASKFKDQVLNLDTVFGEPCIWCLCDTKEELQNIKILVIGTGNPMPLLSKDDYLGSYMLYHGNLVFHVFAKILQ